MTTDTDKPTSAREAPGWEPLACAPMYVYGRDALVGAWDGIGWRRVSIWEPEWTRDDIIHRGGTHWWPHLRDRNSGNSLEPAPAAIAASLPQGEIDMLALLRDVWNELLVASEPEWSKTDAEASAAVMRRVGEVIFSPIPRFLAGGGRGEMPQGERAEAALHACEGLDTAAPSDAPTRIERSSFLGNPHLCTVRIFEIPDSLIAAPSTSTEPKEQ